MLVIFIDIFDLRIALSWLSFESSIPMSFVTCLFQVQNLVMRLHSDVTSGDLIDVCHFYWCLWPNNRIVMTEFWKFNAYVFDLTIALSWLSFESSMHMSFGEHFALWRPYYNVTDIWQTFDSDMFIDSSKPGHEITFWCYFWGLKLCWSFLLISLT